MVHQGYLHGVIGTVLVTKSTLDFLNGVAFVWQVLLQECRVFVICDGHKCAEETRAFLWSFKTSICETGDDLYVSREFSSGTEMKDLTRLLNFHRH